MTNVTCYGCSINCSDAKRFYLLKTRENGFNINFASNIRSILLNGNVETVNRSINDGCMSVSVVTTTAAARPLVKLC